MSRVRGWYWVTAVKAYTLVPEMFAQGQGEEKGMFGYVLQMSKLISACV